MYDYIAKIDMTMCFSMYSTYTHCRLPTNAVSVYFDSEKNRRLLILRKTADYITFFNPLLFASCTDTVKLLEA
jgi:hypothetical protein